MKEWINQIISDAHHNAKSRGFYSADPGHDILQKIKEEVVELQGALSGGHEPNLLAFQGASMVDDSVKPFEDHIKNTDADELADIIITALAGAKELGIDIVRHIELKVEYNKVREYPQEVE